MEAITKDTAAMERGAMDMAMVMLDNLIIVDTTLAIPAPNCMNFTTLASGVAATLATNMATHHIINIVVSGIVTLTVVMVTQLLLF